MSLILVMIPVPVLESDSANLYPVNNALSQSNTNTHQPVQPQLEPLGSDLNEWLGVCQEAKV